MSEKEISIPCYVITKSDEDEKVMIKVCDFCGKPERELVKRTEDVPGTPFTKLLPDGMILRRNYYPRVCMGCKKDACKDCLGIDEYEDDIGDLIFCKDCADPEERTEEVGNFMNALYLKRAREESLEEAMKSLIACKKKLIQPGANDIR